MEELLRNSELLQQRSPLPEQESYSDNMSESDEYSGDDPDYGSGRQAEDDYSSSLQVMDLQTLETDNASSPYSYAFRIDAFTRKVSSLEGEFQNLGQGKYLRQDAGTSVPIEEVAIDPHLGDYLIDYYFRELWPLFPIIDQDAFYAQLRDSRPPIPNSLLCAIYFASASIISQLSRFTDGQAGSPASSLSPRSIPPLPPGILDSLRSNLTNVIATLSSPILEARITTLQTLILRCLYDQSLAIEKRTALISDTVRIAQYILLHRSIAGLSSHDISLRQHLWWTIFVLEAWTSAVSRTPSTLDLAEIDIQLPIESQEPDHQAYTSLVALTRILLDTLRSLYSPTVQLEDMGREVTRLRDWVMQWYCNLPGDLLVRETTSSESADFLLAGCHAVLLLVYGPFSGEDLVRMEMERSRGIITDALGRLGGNVSKFGIVASLISEMARKFGSWQRSGN